MRGMDSDAWVRPGATALVAVRVTGSQTAEEFPVPAFTAPG